jgi:ethanolamine utilization protein EutQ (cupin superfamily)
VLTLVVTPAALMGITNLAAWRRRRKERRAERRAARLAAAGGGVRLARGVALQSLSQIRVPAALTGAGLLALQHLNVESREAGTRAPPATRRNTMVRKFALADASFERSPGQDADIYAANLVDQRHGGPITIGYGRYGPNQSLAEKLAVDDVMIVLEGKVSVTSDAGTVTAGAGEIIYMPKGDQVTIRSHENGAVTAYVTYPHWAEAQD